MQCTVPCKSSLSIVPVYYSVQCTLYYVHDTILLFLVSKDFEVIFSELGNTTRPADRTPWFQWWGNLSSCCWWPTWYSGGQRQEKGGCSNCRRSKVLKSCVKGTKGGGAWNELLSGKFKQFINITKHCRS